MAKTKSAEKRNKIPLAVRLKPEIVGLLKRMSERTGKTQTRLIEEALFLHGKELQ